ncbi:MAG: hypothetical protein U9P00_02135 [Pseudomonadota bacterium]|nr:hypothetical protein [Pseudomonadota bacterium]
MCGGERWYVQKTRPRHGKTLAHGQFEARETVRVCAMGCRHPSGLLVTRGAGSLTQHLPPSTVVGYDVMARVGLERFLQHRQRHEICSMLENEEGIRISTGEVSDLSRRFVHYLARLHQARGERLKAALESDGGWPMHVDATGEGGRGTLLLVMAGWRQWVLGAWKISTERADLILPCLRETVRNFGAPCAAMRDLGRAMTPAIDDLVSELELAIPVLACHQHFLADVGKDLLEPSHAKLRELFRRAKVRPKLRALVRELGRKLGPSIEDARKAVIEWQSMADERHAIESGDNGLAIVRALAQWILDYKAQASGLDYPFDRPYLDLYDRCSTVLRASDAFLRIPPEDKKVKRALERLHRYLAPVDCDVRFRQTTERLRRRAALFDELREVLRLAAIPQKDETEQDLDRMRERLDELVALFKKRRPERGPAQDIREAIDIILKHIDVHGANLWGHVIRLPERAGGGVRLVVRTNFPAENFFGGFKHDERRRSGRKNLAQDLEQLPAEAMLVYNLEHADYVALVCGSLDRLAEAFAQLDFDQHQMRMKGLPSDDRQQDLSSEIQLASASLSTADRRVIRTEEMDRRVAAAARSRAPHRCH